MEILQEQAALRQQEAILNRQTAELLLRQQAPRGDRNKQPSEAGSVTTPRKENSEEKKIRVRMRPCILQVVLLY